MSALLRHLTEYDEEIRWAWAAGMFEGEGCISIAKTKLSKAQYPDLQFVTTDNDVMEAFVRVVGVGTSALYEDTRKRAYKARNQWRIQGRERFLAIYERMEPYLGERRRARAEEVMATAQATSQSQSLAPHPCGYEGCNTITTRTICRPCHTKKWKAENRERYLELKRASNARNNAKRVAYNKERLEKSKQPPPTS